MEQNFRPPPPDMPRFGRPPRSPRPMGMKRFPPPRGFPNIPPRGPMPPGGPRHHHPNMPPSNMSQPNFRQFPPQNAGFGNVQQSPHLPPPRPPHPGGPPNMPRPPHPGLPPNISRPPRPVVSSNPIPARPPPPVPGNCMRPPPPGPSNCLRQPPPNVPLNCNQPPPPNVLRSPPPNLPPNISHPPLHKPPPNFSRPPFPSPPQRLPPNCAQPPPALGPPNCPRRPSPDNLPGSFSRAPLPSSQGPHPNMLAQIHGGVPRPNAPPHNMSGLHPSVSPQMNSSALVPGHPPPVPPHSMHEPHFQSSTSMNHPQSLPPPPNAGNQHAPYNSSNMMSISSHSDRSNPHHDSSDTSTYPTSYSSSQLPAQSDPLSASSSRPSTSYGSYNAGSRSSSFNADDGNGSTYASSYHKDSDSDPITEFLNKLKQPRLKSKPSSDSRDSKYDKFYSDRDQSGGRYLDEPDRYSSRHREERNTSSSSKRERPKFDIDDQDNAPNEEDDFRYNRRESSRSYRSSSRSPPRKRRKSGSPVGRYKESKDKCRYADYDDHYREYSRSPEFVRERRWSRSLSRERDHRRLSTSPANSVKGVVRKRSYSPSEIDPREDKPRPRSPRMYPRSLGSPRPQSERVRRPSVSPERPSSRDHVRSIEQSSDPRDVGKQSVSHAEVRHRENLVSEDSRNRGRFSPSPRRPLPREESRSPPGPHVVQDIQERSESFAREYVHASRASSSQKLRNHSPKRLKAGRNSRSPQHKFVSSSEKVRSHPQSAAMSPTRDRPSSADFHNSRTAARSPEDCRRKSGNLSEFCDGREVKNPQSPERTLSDAKYAPRRSSPHPHRSKEVASNSKEKKRSAAEARNRGHSINRKKSPVPTRCSPPPNTRNRSPSVSRKKSPGIPRGSPTDSRNRSVSISRKKSPIPSRASSASSRNRGHGDSRKSPVASRYSPPSSSSRSHGVSRKRSPVSSRSRTQEDKRSRSPTLCKSNYGSGSLSKDKALDQLSNNELKAKLEELSRMKPEEIIEHEKRVWTRSSPADLYYARDENNPKVMNATQKLLDLCKKFESELVQRSERIRALKPKYEPPPRKQKLRLQKHKETDAESSSESSSGEESSDDDDSTMEELERKKQHPYRLHSELWFNDPGEMNDGPLCRCSAKSRRSGIRHGIYAGESNLNKCIESSNNADKLYHYRITISPPTNFLTKTPTIIKHDEHEFIFEGFSMFSHSPLEKLPTCKVIRFNIEYTILYIDEKLPENFAIQELDLFHTYLFQEILELVDLEFRASGDKGGCPQFHFMPRFVRDIQDNGKEILSMNEVLHYLLAQNTPLLEEQALPNMLKMTQFEWQNFADEVKGMIVTYPGMKPCSVRVDQLDRDQPNKDAINHPEIVHFGIRPPQLSYAGNPEYQRAWREYVKFRHLLANMPKPSSEDKRKLEEKESKLQEMRTQSKMKRDVTIAVSGQGFFRTGIMCDMIQHAMLIPVLVCHLRFHKSLDGLEKTISYKFKNRYLLQLALTHPSYRENFGTNPDHARNSLTNCGIRQPEYGDRRIHYMNTRKRGINTLINIMSRFGKKQETQSNITHNERLEFLGDAVVEFLTSIHLFHMFPDLEEGGLATYRAAIVQNQHLAVLAKILNLEDYMLYAHGSDLCHDLELRHAMANCFEALMGALFIDGGIKVADKVFAETLFKHHQDLLDVWVNYPLHPLQEQEPDGDRKWIVSFPLLQKLTKFEDSIGVEFRHIRLLARAFTDRSIGYNNLTLGSNQRLEFLGDTVLQLIASEYLYKYFPEHHEGHLSLLRSSLVNNRTQAVVCDDLGMTEYALYSNPKAELKTKDRADLLEAFLGALYVDKGLEYCHVFCHVCFFPRLQDFIMNQDWNDPKSKLQQCCLTLRTMDGGEPDIPVYKVIECKGPTNTRVYTVAVYFRGKRLAKASGHSIQQAEMNAAKYALDRSADLFPQLHHQKRVIAKSLKKQKWPLNRVRKAKERLQAKVARESFNKDKRKDNNDERDLRRESYRSCKTREVVVSSKVGSKRRLLRKELKVSRSATGDKGKVVQEGEKRRAFRESWEERQRRSRIEQAKRSKLQSSKQASESESVCDRVVSDSQAAQNGEEGIRIGDENMN